MVVLRLNLFDFISAHPWFDVAVYFPLRNLFCGKVLKIWLRKVEFDRYLL